MNDPNERYRITYAEALTGAMKWLAVRPDTVFIGQSVAYAGTSMYGTLAGVGMDKRIELPVAEEMQLGMSIGLALAGYVPVSIYPRWNFLLLATNQIVNHLDKLPIYSDGGYKPKVIIRTAVAAHEPLDPQSQHLGNFSDAFRQMCRTVEIIECEQAEDIFEAYQWAYERNDGCSSLIVEHTAKFA